MAEAGIVASALARRRELTLEVCRKYARHHVESRCRASEALGRGRIGPTRYEARVEAIATLALVAIQNADAFSPHHFDDADLTTNLKETQ